MIENNRTNPTALCKLNKVLRGDSAVLKVNTRYIFTKASAENQFAIHSTTVIYRVTARINIAGIYFVN